MLIRANDEEYAGNDDSHPPSSQAQLPSYVSPLLGRGQGSAEGLRRRGNRGRVRFDAQRSGEGVQRLCLGPCPRHDAVCDRHGKIEYRHVCGDDEAGGMGLSAWEGKE
jgi:hypothetical protein